ncbi:hypothetical protein PACILC2_18530 [Paenibacillus cisolokensis]|uniref:Hydantoinase B/oxoprolinase domain-containing protein n=1 Tax=Paenibacillus cisolokensis TaxID=1658519 RepID=A0ABQ4N507_9BACL|nr:hydantoinase B/oxoprolinase family protein [Paenibacillus cisolokensis]GIQ63285.1 hypothetical protein PACILC2_18530 [Paenibacillus cisolokensis]
MTVSAADRIEEQIVYGKLASLNRYAGERLQRMSRSPLIAEKRAFAAAVLTPRLELAHQVQFEPEHLYALRDSVRHAFDFFAYDIAEGDVIVTADPYGGGTKGQTLTLVVPTFAGGELVPFPAIRAQMADMGGEIPGGFNESAFELWQENMRVTPLKLYAGGKLQRDVHRFLTANSRTPDWIAADLDAMYACCLETQRSILLLLEQYGGETVERAIKGMFAYTSAEVLRGLPEAGSEYVGEADIPSREASGTIRVRARRDGGTFHFDFAGTSGQQSAPYNATPQTAKACAVIAAAANSIDELPINEGLLETFVFHFPQGCILSPDFPAATGLGSRLTGHAVAAAVTGALRTSGKPFVAVHGPGPWMTLYPPIGSSPSVVPVWIDPGFPVSADGWGPAGLSGAGRLVSAEELELRSGFRIDSRERETDERGDEGVTVRLKVLKGTWEYQLFEPDRGSIDVSEDDHGDEGASRPLRAGDVLTFRYADAEPHGGQKGTVQDGE